jgi:uncharacterized protein YbjT (DUF2867 family)
VAADDDAAEVARVAAAPPVNGIVTIGGPQRVSFEQLVRDLVTSD